MKGPSPPQGDCWQPSLAQRVDQACDRFEVAWKGATGADQRPQIEPYLKEAPEPDRPVLLRELLLLDLDYRGDNGETPAAEEYQQRFPEYAALIAGVFEK